MLPTSKLGGAVVAARSSAQELTPAAARVAELLPSGVAAGIAIDRFTTSTQQGEAWLVELLGKAEQDVLGELFGITNRRVTDAFVSRIADKVPVRANADPEYLALQEHKALIREGAQLRPWGGNGLRKGKYDHRRNPRKVHAKAWHIDEAGVLSTASLLKSKVRTFDATAITSGETARLARRVTQTAFDGDVKALRLAAEEARLGGILLNDPAVGIRHLRQGMDEVIGSAQTELVLAFKIISDKGFARMLAAKAASGVKVTLLTRPFEMTPAVARILRNSKVRLIEDPIGAMHANMVIADKQVGMFMSAHATPRSLGSKGARRQSRELGFVVDDPSVVKQMRRAILDFKPKRAGKGR